MLTIKWLLKSDLVLLFFPLLSSEKLWGSYSKNLIFFSHCLFLTGNINHRCGDFPYLKEEGGVNYTPNYAKKNKTKQKQCKQNKNKTKQNKQTKNIYVNIGHRARSRAKDNRPSLPGPLIEQLNNSVFTECACTYSPDYVILCAVEDARAILRNHFRENVSL